MVGHYFLTTSSAAPGRRSPLPGATSGADEEGRSRIDSAIAAEEHAGRIRAGGRTVFTWSHGAAHDGGSPRRLIGLRDTPPRARWCARFELRHAVLGVHQLPLCRTSRSCPISLSLYWRRCQESGGAADTCFKSPAICQCVAILIPGGRHPRRPTPPSCFNRRTIAFGLVLFCLTGLLGTLSACGPFLRASLGSHSHGQISLPWKNYPGWPRASPSSIVC